MPLSLTRGEGGRFPKTRGVFSCPYIVGLQRLGFYWGPPIWALFGETTIYVGLRKA